uniref:ShKT domain-containing protein n=1 Tax=Amphora coffeiformis TaxID=265554 RepID=A0A7S3P8R6_9STRA
MKQVENEPSGPDTVGPALPRVLPSSNNATEDFIDIFDHDDEPSGIYTFEDNDEDSFVYGSTTIDDVIKAVKFSSDSVIGTGTLVSVKSPTPSDEKTQTLSRSVSAVPSDGKPNGHSSLSLPTGEVEESPTKDSPKHLTRTGHISTPPSLAETEEGRGCVLNVNVPDDGVSMVSSLASTGEHSFMPGRMPPFILQNIGKETPLDANQKKGTARQEAEATSILSGTYESIVQRLQNRDKSRPIQSYISSVPKTTYGVENPVNGPALLHDTDDQSGKVTIAETPDGTDEHSPSEYTDATKMVVVGVGSDSSTARDDSISTNFALSQKLKYHDVSESLLLSRGFRRLVCGFGILILMCILMAIVGTVLIRSEDEVPSQTLVDPDMFLRASSTQVNPPEELDASLSSTAENIAIEASGTSPTPPMSPDYATDTTDSPPTSFPTPPMSPGNATDTTDTDYVTNTTDTPPMSAVSPTSDSLPGVFTIDCKDDPDISFTVGKNEGTCQWLSDQSASEKIKLCESGEEPREACPVTCHNCPLRF